MFRLLKSGLITSGPAPFRSRSPKGTLTSRQLEGFLQLLGSFTQEITARLPGSRGRAAASLAARAPGAGTRGRRLHRPPQNSPRRATHPTPRFQTKCHGRPGGEEPAATNLGRDPSPGGSEGAMPSAGAAAAGAGASPAPSCSSRLHRPGPRPPALHAAPNGRPASPPGRRALEGAGIPGIRAAGLAPQLRALSICLPLLRDPGCSARSPGRAWRGAAGTLRGCPPRSKPGEGRGRAPPSPRTGGQSSQSDAQPAACRHLRVWLRL